MFERFSGDRDGSWVLTSLRRRWWVVLLVAVIAAGAAYFLSSRQTKKYTATSALLFQTTHLDQLLSGQIALSSADPTREAATNQALVELPTVAKLVAGQLHISAGRVASDVAFGSDTNTDVLTVHATDVSPLMASRIANAYVTQYIVFRKSAAIEEINTAENEILRKEAAIPASQQTGTVAQKLISDRNQLDLLKAAQTGDAQVVQTAGVPSSPSFPDPKKDAILGLLLGVLIGAALVLVLERRDRRVVASEEIAAIYGVPVIGAIPESGAMRSGVADAPRDEEAFLMVRAQLRYFDVDRNIKRVMITSAESGEGKTLVSLNLARAAARNGDVRVLLIEADMRRPMLSTRIGRLGRNEVVGLAELLSQSQDLESGLRELVIAPFETEDGSRRMQLDLLLAGATPPNPAELLESKRMSELLELADTIYDMVIIDTSPIGIISDAIPLVHQMDGVIVVSRIGVTNRDHAAHLMTRLRGLSANMLGVVINSFHLTSDSSYAYYGVNPVVERDGRNGTSSRRGPLRTR